jgi:hypothetical protein
MRLCNSAQPWTHSKRIAHVRTRTAVWIAAVVLRLETTPSRSAAGIVMAIGGTGINTPGATLKMYMRASWTTPLKGI